MIQKSERKRHIKSGSDSASTKKKRGVEEKVTQLTVAEFKVLVRNSASTFLAFEKFNGAAAAFQECTTDKEKSKLLDIVSSYIQSSPEIPEFFEVLNIKEVYSKSEVSHLFKALTYVLTSLLNEESRLKYPAVAESIINELSNGHLTKLYNTVLFGKQHVAKEALKLMTTIANHGHTAVRLLFTSIVFTKEDVHAVYNETGASKLRQPFIGFLMAMVDNATHALLKAIVDEKGLLNGLFAKLHTDSYETVQKVLTTLEVRVVNNDNISKTQRVRVFNETTIPQILECYNMKQAPDGKAAKAPQLQSEVRQLVCSFVKVLLTDARRGIIFDDPDFGLGQRNMNHLVSLILTKSVLKDACTDSALEDIVISCLSARPDQIHRYLSVLEDSHLSHKNNQETWLGGANHIIKLFYSLPGVDHYLDCQTLKLDEKTADIAVVLTSPRATTTKIFNHCLRVPNLSWNYSSLGFLLVVLKRATQVLDTIKKHIKGPSAIADYEKWCCLYQTKLLTMLPSMDSVLHNWITINKATDSKLKEFSINRMSFVGRMLDVILLYMKLSPPSVSRSYTSLNVASILQDVEQMTADSQADDQDSDQVTGVTVKAVQLLSEVGDESTQNILKSKKKKGKSTLNVILKFVYGEGDADLQNQSKTLLVKILKKTGWFENLDLELDLWFSLGSTDVIEFMEQCLMTLLSNPYPYLDQIYDAMTTAGAHSMADRCSQMRPLSFSPLIPISQQQFNDNYEDQAGVRSYMKELLSHLLLVQDDPLTLCVLLSDCSIEHLSQCVKILASDKKLKKCPETLVDADSLGVWKELFVVRSWEKSSSESSTEIIKTFSQISNTAQQDMAVSHLILALWSFQGGKKFPMLCEFIHQAVLAMPQVHLVMTRFLESGVVHRWYLRDHCNVTGLEITKLCNNVLQELTQQQIQDMPELLKVLSKRLEDQSSEVLLTSDLYLQSLTVLSDIMSPESLYNLVNKLLSNQLEYQPLPYFDCLKSCINVLLKSAAGTVLDFNYLVKHIDDLGGDHKFKLIQTISESLHRVDILPIAKLIHRLKSQEGVSEQFVDLLVYIIKNSQQRDLISQTLQEHWSVADWVKHLPVTQAVLMNSSKEEVPQFLHLWNPLRNKIQYEELSAHGTELELLKVLTPYCSETQARKCFKKLMSADTCLTDLPTLDLLVELSSKSSDMKLTLALATFSYVSHLTDETVKLLSDRLKPSDLPAEQIKVFQHEMSKDWKNFVFASLRKNYAKPAWLNLVRSYSRLIYADKMSNETNDLSINDLFELLLNHSKFLHIMMPNTSSDRKPPTSNPPKESLLRLLIHLVKTDPSVCKSDHFPIWLSSYQATLSDSDCLLLHLMYLYETTSSISTMAYRPYIWGEAGATRYSVRQGQSHHTSTLATQPSVDSVIECLDKDLLHDSAYKLPVDRALHPCYIEEEELYVSPDAAHDDDDDEGGKKCAYDPAFMLPLFAYIMRPDNVLNTRQLTEQGIITYTLACLTSHDTEIRAAARFILHEFRQHLEASYYSESVQGLYILDLLKESIPDKNLRVPAVITTFISWSLELSPEKHMYRVCHNYLLLRPMMDLDTVPEFYRLFYSSSHQHSEERSWILKLLLISLREDADFHIYEKLNVTKAIMSYSLSTLCSTEDRITVINIVRKVCKLPSGHQVVIKYNVLSYFTKLAEIDNRLVSNVIACLRCLLLSVSEDKPWYETFLVQVLFFLLYLLRNRSLSEATVDVYIQNLKLCLDKVCCLSAPAGDAGKPNVAVSLNDVQLLHQTCSSNQRTVDIIRQIDAIRLSNCLTNVGPTVK